MCNRTACATSNICNLFKLHVKTDFAYLKANTGAAYRPITFVFNLSRNFCFFVVFPGIVVFGGCILDVGQTLFAQIIKSISWTNFSRIVLRCATIAQPRRLCGCAIILFCISE